MKNKHTSLCILALLIIWQILAVIKARDMILPYPHSVFSTMIAQLSSPIFYKSVSITLLRSFTSFSIAFLTSIICAIVAHESKIMKEILAPFLLLTRSVPNISYIILFLVWVGSEKTASFVGILILFPMMYSNFSVGLSEIDKEYNLVLKLYPENLFTKIYKVYLPSLVPFIIASISSGVGLSLKVGVMAEILGQVQIGIGRQLNLCRIDLDMSGIFAWTLWIILILVVLEYVIKRLQKCWNHHLK